MSTTSPTPRQFISARDRATLADPAALAADHLRLARQTRGAVRFIAWLLGISAALSIVFGIITGIVLAHESANLNNRSGNTSNCQILGGC